MTDAARRRSLLFFLIAAFFLLIRLAILAAREPFFDELFTLWMARQPLGRIVPNLLQDSGPPLYYLLARFDSIAALRLLSLLLATLQFVLVARRSLLAGTLLAFYPPAALFAVDARSYALCALLVTAGVLAWQSQKPLAAALLLVLAAYAHDYGVLFFPLLLVPAASRDGETRPSGLLGSTAAARISAFVLALALFIPGLILAFRQPVQALGWNAEPLLSPLTRLSFAGNYPYALFAGMPRPAAMLALILLIAALWRSMRYAPAVLIPLALVLAFYLGGMPVYFPMRFEAVVGGPLALWLGQSLCRWPRLPRGVLSSSLLFLGALSVTIGVIDHLHRPMNPYRQAAIGLRQHLRPGRPVVATGYCYLEAAMALDQPILAWPAEQASHPGWRAAGPADPRALPSGTFVWIGERNAPEISVLRGLKTLRPLFWNDRALVAEATDLTSPVH